MLEKHFEAQLEKVNTWLSFAEAKNGLLIGFNVAAINIVIEHYSQYQIISTIIILLFIISGIINLISFFPRLNNNSLKNAKSEKAGCNLLFGGNIAELNDVNMLLDKTVERYFSTYDEKEYSNKVIDLANEVLINSQIAKLKYSYFKKALLIDILVFVLAIFLCIIA